MTARVYLARLDTVGSRFAALDVSTDAATLVAVRSAAVAEHLDAPPDTGGGPARVVLSVTLDAAATLPAGSLAAVDGTPGDAMDDAARWTEYLAP